MCVCVVCVVYVCMCAHVGVYMCVCVTAQLYFYSWLLSRQIPLLMKDKIFDFLSVPISRTTCFIKVRGGWSTLVLWEAWVCGVGCVGGRRWVGVRGVWVGGRC